MIIVSHDIDDAIELGDEILILGKKRHLNKVISVDTKFNRLSHKERYEKIKNALMETHLND